MHLENCQNVNILVKNCLLFFPPYPLFSVEFCRWESDSSELDDEDLRCKSPNPDGVVDPIAEESFEHVPLTVNLPRVDLIEQGHHDKRVEHHSEVGRGRGAKFCKGFIF